MFASSLSALLRILVRPLRLLARSPSAPPPATPPLQGAAPPAAPAAAVAPARPAAPARAGKYDQALLDLIATHPGITVAEAADEIGLPATGLYPTIRRLQAQGKLAKIGRVLHPAGG